MANGARNCLSVAGRELSIVFRTPTGNEHSFALRLRGPEQFLKALGRSEPAR